MISQWMMLLVTVGWRTSGTSSVGPWSRKAPEISRAESLARPEADSFALSYLSLALLPFSPRISLLSTCTTKRRWTLCQRPCHVNRNVRGGLASSNPIGYYVPWEWTFDRRPLFA